MTLNILAIDPGLKGSLVLTDETLKPVWAYKMPIEHSGRTARVDAVTLYQMLHDGLQERRNNAKTVCLLETPLALPGLANTAIATAATNWGILYATLCLLNLTIEEIAPSTWVLPLHEHFQLTGVEQTPKQKTTQCFRKLFPELPWKHSGAIDALCMATVWVWVLKQKKFTKPD